MSYTSNKEYLKRLGVLLFLFLLVYLYVLPHIPFTKGFRDAFWSLFMTTIFAGILAISQKFMMKYIIKKNFWIPFTREIVMIWLVFSIQDSFLETYAHGCSREMFENLFKFASLELPLLGVLGICMFGVLDWVFEPYSNFCRGRV